jgi:hypothetical protein
MGLQSSGISVGPIFWPYLKKIMDNTNARGPQDRNRVNVNQDHELRYWCKRFGVSAERLREVVQRVGVSVEAIERQLGGSNERRREP